MRRDRAERRARELAGSDGPDVVFYAFHRGRNSWVVYKRRVRGEFYHASEEVER